MHAIKGQFDGEKVVVPEAARGLPPGEVIIVFADAAEQGSERDSWLKVQEVAFSKIWDNDEDAVYDQL